MTTKITIKQYAEISEGINDIKQIKIKILNENQKNKTNLEIREWINEMACLTTFELKILEVMRTHY